MTNEIIIGAEVLKEICSMKYCQCLLPITCSSKLTFNSDNRLKHEFKRGMEDTNFNQMASMASRPRLCYMHTILFIHFFPSSFRLPPTSNKNSKWNGQAHPKNYTLFQCKARFKQASAYRGT